jgi:DNA-directed RNA polymerase beta' subunit
LDHRRCERLANQLAVGDIVYRNLRDGDLVVLNRQPTLHRNGFTAHVVRVLPDLAIHLPQDVTRQFGADFDGDEMNMHVPQTLQSISELHFQLSLRENCLAANEQPAFEFIQNTMVTAYMLTGQDVLLTRAQACQLMMAACEPKAPRHPLYETRDATVSIGDGFRPRFQGKLLPIPAIQYKRLVNDRYVHVELWTGSQLISGLMPPIDIGDVNKLMSDDANDAVVMRGGTLISGQLSKRELGAGKHNLLHSVFAQYNGIEFMDEIKRLCASYLTMRGFTIGLRDCQIDTRDDELPPTEADAKGPTLVHRMNHLRTLTRNFVEEHVAYDNALRYMFDSGSKGKALNTTQIVTAVGPQYIGGRLPPQWLGSRSLPCFAPGDERPVARGYIDRGYLEGLDPAAMFFHCAATRDSLVTANMIPAESGELQRLMCECLKPLSVDYEGKVVGEGGSIVQFAYGGDGLDWTGQIVEPGTPVSYYK